MKKCMALLLVLITFLCAASAAAANGTAEFAFMGETYRVTYVRSEIAEGKLNVVVSGFGNRMRFVNNQLVVPAWCSARTGGKELQAGNVHISGDGVYTYVFNTDQMPDKLFLYPHDDEKNPVLLWDGSAAADSPAPTQAPEAAEEEKVRISFDGKPYNLSIGEFGFTDKERTTYRVTVEGFNILLTGKSGNISELMPFKVAVAWSPEAFLPATAQGVETGNRSTFYFQIPENAPEEDPKYILITPYYTQLPWGHWYVIAEGRFHPGTEFAGEEPSPTPTPTPTPKPTPTPSPTPTPTPTPVPEADTNLLKQPGQVVKFGRYPQTAAGDDLTPVEWLVLDYDEDAGRALLISRYVLDAEPYHLKPARVTWEECSLRAWLNDEFLNTAFTPEEQQAILETDVDNSQAAVGKGGGNDTRDRIFVLSKSDLSPEGVFRKAGIPKQLTSSTEYVNGSAGSPLSSNPKTEEGTTSTDWWIRNPIKKNYTGIGAFWNDETQEHVVIYPEGVRPVFWVNVDSDFFSHSADGSGAPQTVAAPDPAAEPVQAASHPEALKSPGAVVLFGTYPQTIDSTYLTPIQWQVLAYDAEANRALLLSRYGLDVRQYHDKQANVTWEKSSLRKWLNSEFLENAFTPGEQAAILVTELDNGAEQQGYPDTLKKGGKKTKDQVFLLSFAETGTYLRGHRAKQCAVTDYAFMKGAYTDGKHFVGGRPAGMWMTRSPGKTQKGVAAVDKAGYFSAQKADYEKLTVRPAVWVDLNAEYFN